MRVVLTSTYELGHQPFGLASPAAWLNEAGADVTCLDLAVRPFIPEPIAAADLVAFYLPMHTATRLAVNVIRRVQRINPQAHLCAYGLYAPVNDAYLRRLGVHTILGGEFEQGLVDLVQALSDNAVPDLPAISLARQPFRQPDRSGLPPLSEYAYVEVDGERRTAGYTEATRGCKHRCRHCPIVPVYDGRFRIVQPQIVMADIRQQVAAGAQHITFGDPDFLNGPGHALPIVQALHEEFPDLTYDVTIKIEHLRQHDEALPLLRETGCLFVTSAVEAVDDHILEILDKGHTRADFIQVVRRMREVGLALNPTFVAFTPWTSRRQYAEFLALLEELDLVEHVNPIQYAIRLLIPAGSRLLELPQTQAVIDDFDEAALVYPWQHPDPGMDDLYEELFRQVKANQKNGESRRLLFERIWRATVETLPEMEMLPKREMKTAVAVPKFSEDWY